MKPILSIWGSDILNKDIMQAGWIPIVSKAQKIVTTVLLVKFQCLKEYLFLNVKEIIIYARIHHYIIIMPYNWYTVNGQCAPECRVSSFSVSQLSLSHTEFLASASELQPLSYVS